MVQRMMIVSISVAILLIYSCVHYVTSLAVPTGSSQFLYITCKAKSEKLLKREISEQYPTLRFAFSRPGLLTFKESAHDSYILPSMVLHSAFAINYGCSIDQCDGNDIEGIIKRAKELASQYPSKHQFRLHVYDRDEGGLKVDHPQYIIDKKNQINTVYAKLYLEGMKDDIWLTSNIINQEASVSEHVFNVIVGTPDEKVLLGHYVYNQVIDRSIAPTNAHSRQLSNRLPYAGGVFPVSRLPPDSPSRAYMKIEEAIDWTSGLINMEANEVAVEVGSAPGGQAYALLQKGLNVYGIDPSTTSDRRHAPIVSNNKKFIHIQKGIEDVDMSDLPSSIDYLLCDANIQPMIAITHLSPLLSRYATTLKAFIFTCKLNDEVWSNDKHCYQLIALMQQKIKGDFDFRFVAAKQLVNNRQEICVIAVTKKGLATV